MELSRDKIKEIINDDWLLMDDCEGNKNCDVVKEMARIALASLEAEPVAWLLSGGGAKNNVSFDSGNAYADPLREVTPLYTAPPAPVSVPDYPEVLPCPVMLEPGLRFGKGVNTRTMLGALQRRAEYHAELEAMTTDERAEHDAGMKEFAAMLQGAEPVTTNDDGGRYEQDDYPECGWVVTHSGKDYFYREQKDAVMHMNSAVESGLGVSLRSFIPEPVSEHHKLNDIVIPDAYDIEAFGIFSATEGESGLLLQIEQFWFGTENCPQIGKENMVPKFALQAIINRLQVHCNSMGEDTLIDIFASSAAPQQEVK